MSTVVNLLSRTAAVGKTGLLRLGIALLVSIGLLGPSVPLAQAALWYVTGGGPPLDFDAPHNGQVVAHIDVLGKLPPDIARIRVSEERRIFLKSGTTRGASSATDSPCNW